MSKGKNQHIVKPLECVAKDKGDFIDIAELLDEKYFKESTAWQNSIQVVF